MSGWDHPRIRINRIAWARRFWLVVPHRSRPYLNMQGEPVNAGVLKGRCRRCRRRVTH